jgi:hypothetical protein
MPDRHRLLELALKGLVAERAKIDDEIIQIKSQLNHRPTTAQTATVVSPTAAPPRKRTMSAAARRRISEGMKRRYAEMRKAGQTTHRESVGLRQSSSERQIGGSRLTAAGRKRLSEAAKRRWAANRKTGKTTL